MRVSVMLDSSPKELAKEGATNMPRTIRRLRVRHTTRYSYDMPVMRSSHKLHLRPIDDWKQQVLSYELRVTPKVPVVEYEDVFANWASRFELNEPYTELTITADSLVDVLDVDPFEFARLPIRPQFPLVWMPR